MSAANPPEAVDPPLDMADLAASLRQPITADLKIWPLLTILASFWIYVTLSNVLYAHNMQASLSSVAHGRFFAAWDARVIQHLFLFPVLVSCVWASLRLGWIPPWRAVPIQLALAVVFSALAAPALVGGEMLTSNEGMAHEPHTLAAFLAGPEPPLWLASAINMFLTYGFGLALSTGFVLYQRFRDYQLRSAALERALTSAHLAALRMQLSPHTLFNLLHTIRGQIGWDPTAAQAMVVQLGELLRRLLRAGERDFTRLSDELRFVQLYLELQQKRFADRLTVWIAEPNGLPSLWVPSLILQPLVENAVVHGLAGHGGAVDIRVEAVVNAEMLTLRVVNTIAPDSVAGQDGIGLRNVRERLAVQFGEGATFSSMGDANNWTAEIRMPVLRDGPDAPILRDKARAVTVTGNKPDIGRGPAAQVASGLDR